jgi:hypothetical protein
MIGMLKRLDEDQKDNDLYICIHVCLHMNTYLDDRICMYTVYVYITYVYN